ncbi:MAG TPA: UDP-N-acetylmuramoyl-tripeptide--D-alanyl-D-alanine ligase [Bryobacteraceae bacterium]|nr:UDP-N-acetylmuramoyl-tripeptide--D-alanyl-D-alanine ligase [Bryobacteraceae bacterium]
MNSDLARVARAVGSAASVEAVPVTGWSVDTRTVAPGDLFFGLKGPNHDGGRYVADALAKGASGAVAEVGHTGEAARTVVVADALQALQQLAAAMRSEWPGTVVGVTGSAGKTTTKETIAALLAVEMAVGKTEGNLNNHVGLPLSILRLPAEARAAVLEIGMNHPGEIRHLACIARPQIGVVTMVGLAHAEFFDSADDVALAKRELIESLPPDGTAVLNADDPRVARFRDVHAGRVVTFGINEPADIRPEAVEYTGEGVRFRLDGNDFEAAYPGRHGVLNILAGIAVAREFGIAPQRLVDAVRALRPGKMRGERTVHAGVQIFNDCYNSNPDAVRSMLDVLRGTPARRRIAVLGEMLELGRFSEDLHREAGRYAARCGVDVLVGIRGAAEQMVEEAVRSGLPAGAAFFFEDPAEAGEFLRRQAREGDAVLFKGSRGTKVEKALETFLGAAEAPE